MIRVREAMAADAAVVAELINAINGLDGNRPAPPMTAAVVVRDLLGHAPRAWLRVAERAGEVIGFATATAIYDAKAQGEVMMLLDLYVTPAARRQGAARALMAALAAQARAQDAPALWWGVDEGDHEATLFYRSIGARSEGRFSGEILTGEALARLAGA